MTGKLLDVQDLRIELARGNGRDRTVIVRDVSLQIAPGEALGLVGESGSGKSMTTKAIMRLLPPKARTSGTISYRGDDVLGMSRAKLAGYRGPEVGMIFQDPRAHINPLWTIGQFLTEAVVAHKRLSRPQAEERAVALLADVGIADGGRRLRQYPYQLSGGLLQRIMIVAALMEDPKLILADEITTALDVTVQSEVMAILDELRVQKQLGLLFITHDLDLAAAVTDRIAVMYAGTIVETGTADEVVHNPRHPYTAGLLASRPRTDQVRRLTAIPGRPRSANDAGDGCPFVDRCAYANQECRTTAPQLREVGGHSVACHRADELRERLREAVVA